MTKLAGFSGKNIVKKLQKIGFVQLRQHGSHARLFCEGRGFVTVPMHRELDAGFLRKIIKDARLDTDEFLAL